MLLYDRLQQKDFLVSRRVLVCMKEADFLSAVRGCHQTGMTFGVFLDDSMNGTSFSRLVAYVREGARQTPVIIRSNGEPMSILDSLQIRWEFRGADEDPTNVIDAISQFLHVRPGDVSAPGFSSRVNPYATTEFRAPPSSSSPSF